MNKITPADTDTIWGNLDKNIAATNKAATPPAIPIRVSTIQKKNCAHVFRNLFTFDNADSLNVRVDSQRDDPF
jgi:hypothetical protein